MTCNTPNCSKRHKKRLKPFVVWVLKHKKANHPVSGGIYLTEREANESLNDIPLFGDSCYRSCYELVKCVTETGEER